MKGPVEPLKAPRLAEVLADRIREGILAQSLGPGEALPSEQELIQRYGVSRSVVREAVVYLKGQGIIDVRQGKGVFVSKVPLELLLQNIRSATLSDKAKLDEVWELRLLLEVQIAGLAASRRTGRDLEQLEEAVDDMDRAFEQGGLGDEEDARFHSCLVVATANSALARVIGSVGDLVRSSVRAALARKPGQPRLSNEEHKRILGAVQAQDVEGAKGAMHRHLERAMKELG